MVRLVAHAPSAEQGSDVADSVQTLAVLLQAGAVPLVAWRHLASTGDPVAVAVLARTEKGVSLVSAIEEQGGMWTELAAAWEIATTVGAPLADVLRSIAEALRDAASAADDVRVALAEPAGTARLLLWMPLAGLLLGVALGFDAWGVIVGNPLGAACVVTGLLLVVLARLWTQALLRRARPQPGTPGMAAELVGVALAGGAPIDRAVELVAETRVVDAAGRDRVQEVLDLSRAAGVPAVELLRATAAQDRHRARIHGRLRAARLSTRLLLPLGVCTLPAFLLLGVAPLLLSVFAATPLPT
ncbi:MULTISPECIES: type II secretion system F family protein [unclassified Microbacterium]|uniref:type II secretion system F family protein n=1 Tax=unclassified Microbacterium TaxID=2609290 RepID=UPI002468DA00|nr:MULTISPECIES: type II secretion system F family protein [unclassified Microbacterium]MDH5134608.1 type II secretion system F family protein [Microbacterium sp. RD10]MDH5138162.1 type II secretion system F family protein [Microbacterium sp. RD11]MDH5146118.1 type II secretion system F family protein [Microbacterium sp. RD12]MDH5156167.1 type II secretion system F family protein [Microbacterium sp. RD06]MDH5168005.1 type II secretion system F family protein [Microbacterium sp. RD02]